MTLLERMDLAAKEDRERFFKVADTIHLQPKYAENLEELETIKQQWRDMTGLENYPKMAFPFELPEWFPKVDFKSGWDEDYYDEEVEEYERDSEGEDV
jgi:hypothetical protein